MRILRVIKFDGRAMSGAVGVATLIALSATGCSSSGKSGSGDPASLLAKDDGSSNLAAYSSALDAWQAKCTETRVLDAGYADAAFRDEQKNNGPDTSRLEVMRNLTKSVPDSIAPTNCDSVSAAYLVLVEK